MPVITPQNPLFPLMMRAAWTVHYMAKGCTYTKAAKLATKRLRSGKRTWPPKTIISVASN